MKYIDLIFYIVFLSNVLYLFIFAFASVFKIKRKKYIATSYKRIVVLIPAYGEDSVIEESVKTCLDQDYPKDKFKVAVISDHMEEDTNVRLSALPIDLFIANYDNSTKSKALNLALSQLEDFDIALVLDADNTIDSDFLRYINDAFTSSKAQIVQAHRTAKNMNTNLAVLDAISEEVNNNLFRQGHANLGLSAALIGSGIAFDFQLFKTRMSTIIAVGGFDKNLELSFLRDRIHIDYLPYAYVYDEKVQSYEAFSNQRKRWLSAQLHYFNVFLKDVPKAIVTGNIDFCNKFFQQITIPRVILFGVLFLIALFMSIFFPMYALKWGILFLVFCLVLVISIPRKLFNRRLLYASMDLPKVFFLMIVNLFKLRGANRKFIHTPHGIDHSSKKK